MRDFTKVAPAIWASPRFLSLDSDGRVVMLYILTGPHMTSAGSARIKDGYAMADLDWNRDRYLAARDAVVAGELVLHDGEEFYALRWFNHCAPSNLKHALGTMTAISKIVSDRIREQAELDFAATKWGEQAIANTQQARPETGNSRLTGTSFMTGGGVRSIGR